MTIASTLLAILPTENPQAMILIGGALCAIFGGVTATFFARKKGKEQRSAVKQV